MDRDALLARLQEIGNAIEPIQGWLDHNAGAVMYQMALAQTASPVIVELGSWKGRSTAWLASGVRDRGTGYVVAVDTWKGTPGESKHTDLLKGYAPEQLFDEFTANMAHLGLTERIEAWRMTTLEAARRWDRGPIISILHVDAGHEYADVRTDFEHWAPHVAPGGFIVFDDVPGWPGPSRVVTELPHWYQYFRTSVNQWWVRKVPP